MSQASSSFRSSLLTAASAAALIIAAPSIAGAQQVPQGGMVVSGQASIPASTGNTLTVQQSSARAVVNWSSFDVGAQSRVVFQQPNASSSILNRVTGSTTSTIAGRIDANGQVVLVNPNGIIITPTGAVAAHAGFVASTLDIADRDYETGALTFRGRGRSAAVTNAGAVRTGAGGLVALLGGSVENRGTISAPLGKIALGAGEQATLDLSGDGVLQVALPSQAADADGRPLISNTGKIRAGGGRIEIKAATARTVARDAINLGGVVSASSARRAGGAIVLDGGAGGRVRVTGRLAARSKLARGGAISIGGRTVSLEKAKLDVRGATGGGSATIGGGARGQAVAGLTIAERVSVDASSRIDASATQSGAGGAVTIWSDVATDFAGAIAARGIGGRGGEAEVSGHGLSYRGFADLLSTGGPAGTLLLDPWNVTVSSAADNGTSGFAPSAAGANIDVATLQSALASANVIVATAGAGSETGDISVNANVAWSAPTSLTLSAAGGINLNANISATDAASALNLTSTGGLTGAGSIVANGSVNVTQSGTSTYSGDISGAGQLTVAGGGWLKTAGALSYTGATRSDTGTIEILGTLGSNGVYAGDISTNTRIRFSGAPDLTLTGRITGSGLLNKNNPSSVLTLAGVNTMTGIFYINEGTLKAGSNMGFSASARFHMATNTTVDLNGYSPTIGLLTGSGKVTNSRSGASTMYLGGEVWTGYASSNVIEDGAGVVSIVKRGSNDQQLGGRSTFSGGLTIEGGSVRAAGSGSSVNGLGTGPIAVKTGATLDMFGARGTGYAGVLNLDGGTLTNSISSFASVEAQIRLSADSTISNMFVGDIDLGASQLTLLASQVSGAISGRGSLVGYGVLSGASTYSGSTRVAGGVLQLAGRGVLGGGIYGGAITIDRGAELHSSSTSSQVLSGPISGAGSLIMESNSSTARLTLAGANTFTGGLTASSGVLDVAGSIDVGAGTLTASVASGATLTGSGAVTAGALALSGAGTTSLTGANRLGQVTTSGTLGALTLNNAQSLTLNSVNSTGALKVTASGAASDLTLASGATLSSQATGDAIAIGAGRNVLNRAGASVLSTPRGRWIVYSAAPEGNVYAGLNSIATAIWNTSLGASVTETGNRYAFAVQPTLTVQTTDLRKTYGDDVTASVANAWTASGLRAGVEGAYQADTLASVLSGALSVTSEGSAARADVSYAPYAVIAARGGASIARGYALAFNSTGRLTIDKAQLTASILAADKVYDGTTTATLSSILFNGLVDGDASRLSLTAGSVSFNSKNVASASTVTASGLGLSGAAAGNYQLVNSSATAAARISARSLTAAANDKVYDGTTTATISLADGGLVAGDVGKVSVSVGAGGFDSKDVATASRVSASGLRLEGAEAGNYQLAQTSLTAAARITAAPLAVRFAARTKIYDGSTTASALMLAPLGTFYNDDAASLGVAARSILFDTAAPGASKRVTASGLALTGAAGGNYRLLSSSAVASAAIVPPFAYQAAIPQAGATTIVAGAPSLTSASHRCGKGSGDSLWSGGRIELTSGGQACR